MSGSGCRLQSAGKVDVDYPKGMQVGRGGSDATESAALNAAYE